jgi:hypothetical protein
MVIANASIIFVEVRAIDSGGRKKAKIRASKVVSPARIFYLEG